MEGSGPHVLDSVVTWMEMLHNTLGPALCLIPVKASVL